jgi:hypothetical protein
MFLVIPLDETRGCDVRGIKGINAVDRPVEPAHNIPLLEMVKGIKGNKLCSSRLGSQLRIFPCHDKQGNKQTTVTAWLLPHRRRGC